MLKEEEPAPLARMVFKVRRHAPELVLPAAETPWETKRLSALDDALGQHVPLALFFRRGGGGGVEEDPVSVIRRALGEALVHYYPLAGRVREIDQGGKELVVECTGEGVLLVQADADVRLADLEAAAGGLRPPFPCWDQLLHVVEGASGVFNSPLLLIQVTRLLCGSFVFALHFNHTLCDGIGIAQFLNAVGELARALPSSITVTPMPVPVPVPVPVWCRELIQVRQPPRPSSTLRGFNNNNNNNNNNNKNVPPNEMDDMVNRCFTFRSSDVLAIRKTLPSLLRDTATTFEVLSALVWRARTLALQVKPGTTAALVFPTNIRGAGHISLPKGYYGNATVPTTVQVDAEVLCGGSLGDTVALVRLHKTTMNTEYVRSIIDELVLVGRRWIWPQGMFYLSDFRRVGLNTVDFGWGVPEFAGPVDTFFGLSPLIAVKEDSDDGREGEILVVPVTLPRLAMDRFAVEVQSYVS